MSAKNFMSYGDAETVLTGFANAIKNNEDAVAAIKDGTDLDSFGDVEVALLYKADTSDLAGKQAKYETITYAQWQALTPAQQAAKDYYISDYPSSVLTAGNIAYDNTSSGMAANKVQGAIDELKSGLNSVYGFAYSVESRIFDSTSIVEYEILHDGFYVIQLQSLNTQAHDLYCTLKVNGTPIVTPFLSQYVTYQYDKLSTVIPLKAGAVLYAVGAENDAMLIMRMS